MSLRPPVPGATLLLVLLGGCGPAPVEAVAISSQGLVGGLVAHWPFDEQGGNLVADRGGRGRDGQLTGGSWVEGRFGGGLRLQPGESVTIPVFPHATVDWTVSVWIKLSAADWAALTTDRATDRAVLLTAEKAMGGWEIEFDPRTGFDWLEASYFAPPPTSDFVVLRSKRIEFDRWVHWTAVFDSTTHQFSLYRDSLLADRADLPASILPGDSDLNIGRWYQGARSISGVIDDYAIWSRALSGDEVAAIDGRAVPDPL